MSFVVGIVGAGLLYATVRKFAVDDRFAKEGQTTTAAVLKASKVDGGRNHPHHDQIVQYHFQIDGQTYQGTADVSRLRRSLKNVGRSKEIDVSYLPSDPTINRPAEEKNLPIAIGLLPLTVPSLLFVLFAWQLRRDFVLAGASRLTTGIVIGTVSYAHSNSVYYDFPNDRGGVTRGNSMLQLPYSWNARLGSVVQVLYVPGEPERNTLKLSLSWKA